MNESGTKPTTLEYSKTNGFQIFLRNKSLLTVSGNNISFEVVADGCLIITGNGTPWLAFSAGEWLTVGNPPV
jgi:hypothetical protein